MVCVALSTPRPRSCPAPMAFFDCVMLYVVPPGSWSGLRKLVSRCCWYGLRIGRPAAGRTPSTRTASRHGRDRECGDVRPGRPGDEEHRADGRAVHERRAEVGLEEDEEDRDRREAERGERRAKLVAGAASAPPESRQARARTGPCRTRKAGSGRSRGRASAWTLESQRPESRRSQSRPRCCRRSNANASGSGRDR